MLNARILASAHYFQPLEEAAELPSLSAPLAEVCRQRPRRIDRFTQLALLGAARCARTHAPDAECGVYLATGAGPLSSNIEVQTAILAEQGSPMPVSFINTLGGAAVFHVASQLGLRGPAMCISRHHASLEAAWSTALLDLWAGVGTQALVGVVEEITLPLSAHRRRLGLAEQVRPGEGSHWWLLQADPGPATKAALHWHPNLAPRELPARLAEAPLCLGRSLDAASLDDLRTRFPAAQTPALPAPHDSPEALWMMQHAGSDCALLGHAGPGQLNLFRCLA